MGLNDGYATARGQILMKTTPPSVNQAYALIIQDECQKSSSVGNAPSVGHGHFSSGEEMDPTALITARGGTSNKKFGYVFCDYCHIRGHTRSQCFKLKFCHHCKSKGHLKENCYQLIGYPSDFKGKRKANVVTSSSEQQILAYQSPQGHVNHCDNVTQYFNPNQYAQIMQLLHNSKA